MAQTGISASWPSWHMYLNRISAYLSVLAVYYISYIPFLFIFPYLGVDKIILFIIIALLNLSLILIAELPRAITGCIGFRKQNVLALCLYLVFALYTLCSYAVIGEFLNHVFTLRTLTLVNPIFVLFAISCLGNKKEVIIATFLFSFVYFAFLIQSMVQGDIQTGQMNILGTVSSTWRKDSMPIKMLICIWDYLLFPLYISCLESEPSTQSSLSCRSFFLSLECS